MNYRFRNGKLIRIGGNITTTPEISTKETEILKPEKPKHITTDEDIIDKIKKVKIDNTDKLSNKSMEKRLEKFVHFKI